MKRLITIAIVMFCFLQVANAQLDLKYFDQNNYKFLAVDITNFDTALSSNYTKLKNELTANKFEIVDKNDPVFFAGDMENNSQGVSMDTDKKSIYLMWVDKKNNNEISKNFVNQYKQYFNRTKDNTDYYVIPYNDHNYTIAIKHNNGIEEIFVMQN